MALWDAVTERLADPFSCCNRNTTLLYLGVMGVGLIFLSRRFRQNASSKNLPPMVPYSVPFVGSAVQFGLNPIEFLENAYEKYGPVFSMKMMGSVFTYVVGSDASALFFNSKNEDLNAEEIYGKLVTPVFGKGVAYDVPNSIFLEQKKMFKTGLNVSDFKRHVPLLIAETVKYFERWGDEGERNLFEAMAELIVLTASRCLQGEEIREVLNEEVAQLYSDLDGGFSHEAWLLPAWLPLPSFRRRDAAQKRIKEIFFNAIQKRRTSGRHAEDILQTLIEATYKDGRHLTDDEISGMLIGLLMAGQHTSSTTGSWLGFFLAKDQALQAALVDEQKHICGEPYREVTFEAIRDMSLLDRCVKETLRLRPPIMTMMRMVKTEQEVKGYVIPPGHQICVSPPVNQRVKDTWESPNTFDPDRYLNPDTTSDTKFSYVPFGAGRHRCIGEQFAYVQIKTIWAVLLQKYEFDLVDGYFPETNFATMIHTPKNPIIRYKLRQN
ncbi:Lanosterol 14-alpha demethylase [Hypsibius exemplaris]|uniref:Lanosterol 14-alpha demethylase n=1 Tax=Hypsibius exemplaris TaxID=2072580 RepID=A0A1W0WNQ3_HYPEX|nr:Lanosterol 14-alpha demethylase [Hypsibius exemplaris]